MKILAKTGNQLSGKLKSIYVLILNISYAQEEE